MSQTLEILRIFSKPLLLLVLPFFMVLLMTTGRPIARKVGLIGAAMFVFIACYPIVAIVAATAVALADSEPTITVMPGSVEGYLVNGKQVYTAVPSDYPLRLSYYDPSLGGINCDHDCTTMASGDKVAAWVNGRNGVYAAACPREWNWRHGARFSVSGLQFECRDTGGWINCYTPGEYDPAMKSVAAQDYCWVDLMIPSPIAPYGTLTTNWNVN